MRLEDIKKMAAAMQEVAEAKKKKMDPVGQADADIDNDGDVDSTDKYLHKRRKAIGKAMKQDEATKVKCPDCDGDGCDHCDDKGYHLDEKMTAAMQAKLSKASASSKSGKDKVSLKKAPWDKKDMKEGYGGNVINAAKMYMKDSSCSYEQAAEKYGCSAEDVRKCTEYLMAQKKNEAVEEETPRETYKQKMKKRMAKREGGNDEIEVNPKKKMKKDSSDDTPMESTTPVLDRILEKRAERYRDAAKADDLKDNDTLPGKGAKEMDKDLKVTDKEFGYKEKESHDTVSKAERTGPSTKHRQNDNKQGDKKIVNPVKGTH